MMMLRLSFSDLHTHPLSCTQHQSIKLYNEGPLPAAFFVLMLLHIALVVSFRVLHSAALSCRLAVETTFVCPINELRTLRVFCTFNYLATALPASPIATPGIRPYIQKQPPVAVHPYPKYSYTVLSVLALAALQDPFCQGRRSRRFFYLQHGVVCQGDNFPREWWNCC